VYQALTPPRQQVAAQLLVEEFADAQPAIDEIDYQVDDPHGAPLSDQ